MGGITDGVKSTDEIRGVTNGVLTEGNAEKTVAFDDDDGSKLEEAAEEKAGANDDEAVGEEAETLLVAPPNVSGAMN
jgi:hypothetical protein